MMAEMVALMLLYTRLRPVGVSPAMSREAGVRQIRRTHAFLLLADLVWFCMPQPDH